MTHRLQIRALGCPVDFVLVDIEDPLKPEALLLCLCLPLAASVWDSKPSACHAQLDIRKFFGPCASHRRTKWGGFTHLTPCPRVSYARLNDSCKHTAGRSVSVAQLASPSHEEMQPSRRSWSTLVLQKQCVAVWSLRRDATPLHLASYLHLRTHPGVRGVVGPATTPPALPRSGSARCSTCSAPPGWPCTCLPRRCSASCTP